MPTYRPPLADLKFVLTDVLQVGQRTDLPALTEITDDLTTSVIDEFSLFATQILGPLNELGDLQGVRLGPDGVVTPDGFARAYRQYVDGGWPALTCAPEHGGDGMPTALRSAVDEMLAGANMAFAMSTLISPGAYQMLTEHALDDLRNRYLDKIVSGEWTAAMSLTEPQCGSALGLIRTKATPASDGTYHVTGAKIFNSWGDHDMADNIVHFLLARLPEAPAGTRGLSLLLVPKFIVERDGSLGQRNGWSVGGVEHKLGIHGSPTCTTNFDSAVGYLIGEPHRGLEAMFVVMNAMRLATGVSAVGVAGAAYEHALAYTRERLAGRAPSGPEHPELDADPIIVHPDVRRMLMSMKSTTEGGRMLCAWVSLQLDIARSHPDAHQRAAAEALVSLLIPIVKAFLSDKATEVADTAVQCFGGWGVIREVGAEQYLRDVRFLRLGEGTSGIQALDFLGRKVVGDDASTLTEFFEQCAEWIQELGATGETDTAAALTRALEVATGLTAELLAQWKQDREALAAVASDYLHLVGYIALGGMWAQMACVAHRRLSETGGDGVFLQNKIKTATFYAAYALPEVDAAASRIRAGATATMAIAASDY